MKTNDLDLVEIFVRIPSTRIKVYKNTHLMFLPDKEPASYKQELVTEIACIFLDKRMELVKKLLEDNKLLSIGEKKYFIILSDEDKAVCDKFLKARDFVSGFYATNLSGLNLEDDFFKERLVFYKL